MTNKPILTEEQFQAKVDEFNNMPREDRLMGMSFSLDCEHVRNLVQYAWNFAKETAEKEGKTNLAEIFAAFAISAAKTVVQGIGAPEHVVNTLGRMLADSNIFKGMLWHVFTEVAPEEDVVLLTGTFNVYSEVSNG